MKFFIWRLWISEDFLKTLKVKKLVWPWRLGIHLRNMKREDFCFRSFIFYFLSHRKHRTVKGGRGKISMWCSTQNPTPTNPFEWSHWKSHTVQSISSVTETKFFWSLRNLFCWGVRNSPVRIAYTVRNMIALRNLRVKIPTVAVLRASCPKISTLLMVISLKGIYVLSCGLLPRL